MRRGRALQQRGRIADAGARTRRRGRSRAARGAHRRLRGLDATQERQEATYDAIARLISCDRSEVAVLENATRAWDMAFYAIDFRPGDRILTASAEYGSNFIAYLQVAQRTGATVEVVPDDESGQLSVTELERLLDDRVKLVSVTHVPTNGGLVNPAEAIGAVVRDSPALFLLDACQSAGQLPLDVERVGCDLLTVTGRKFLRGPRATGFLYAREGTTAHLEPPFLDVRAAHWDAPDRYTMRSDARRFETWETNRAANIGLGVAIEYALEVGIEAIADRDTRLARRLRELLAAIPGVQVLDLGPAPCAIVSFLVSRAPRRGGQGGPGRADHQRLDLRRAGHSHRHGAPRLGRVDPRLRSLLQHRGGAAGTR